MLSNWFLYEIIIFNFGDKCQICANFCTCKCTYVHRFILLRPLRASWSVNLELLPIGTASSSTYDYELLHQISTVMQEAYNMGMPSWSSGLVSCPDPMLRIGSSIPTADAVRKT